MIKQDKGKWEFSLLPAKGLPGIAKAMRHGTNKYGRDSWREGTDWSKYYDALHRHIAAWWERNDLDGESGLHHLFHAGCCVLILLEYILLHKGTDDRPHIKNENLRELNSQDPAPIKMVYLAGPIDRAVPSGWQVLASQMLADRDIASYIPMGAFVGGMHSPLEVIKINAHALETCDALLVHFPKDVPTIGSAIELEVMKNSGKPIAIWTDIETVNKAVYLSPYNKFVELEEAIAYLHLIKK